MRTKIKISHFAIYSDLPETQKTAIAILIDLYDALMSEQNLWNTSQVSDGHSFAFHGANILRNAVEWLNENKISGAPGLYFPIFTRDTRIAKYQHIEAPLVRIDDGFEYPSIICAHAWVVSNKCAWCGERMPAKPVVYDYGCFPDDIETDEDSHCPKCGTNTRSQECTSLFCDDGYVDEYEDDAINFAPGEEYSRCSECYGTGIERWCPNCGWQWRGEKLSE